jgi:PII-like signaling protein
MVSSPPDLASSKESVRPQTRDLPQECILLRIFLGEADEYQRRPLYKAIVLRARELGIAGATVLRGGMGFGRSAHLHNANILRLSLDLPMIVEIVDTAQKIDTFLPELQRMMRSGLITMERAQIIRYSHSES